jgi:radical SAM protein with 4Fe4S-binding SPASM domain
MGTMKRNSTVVASKYRQFRFDSSKEDELKKRTERRVHFEEDYSRWGNESKCRECALIIWCSVLCVWRPDMSWPALCSTVQPLNICIKRV